jgi:hypothetical protein
MAKIYTTIGFGETIEETPGTWTTVITERKYYGDLTKNTRRLQTADRVNDNVTISNEVSIIADPYAYENFHSMRYVEFMGTKWKVDTIDVQYPRLNLSLGGVYNE